MLSKQVCKRCWEEWNSIYTRNEVLSVPAETVPWWDEHDAEMWDRDREVQCREMPDRNTGYSYIKVDAPPPSACVKKFEHAVSESLYGRE